MEWKKNCKNNDHSEISNGRKIVKTMIILKSPKEEKPQKL
jgi:hypothetical protein